MMPEFRRALASEVNVSLPEYSSGTDTDACDPTASVDVI